MMTVRVGVPLRRAAVSSPVVSQASKVRCVEHLFQPRPLQKLSTSPLRSIVPSSTSTTSASIVKHASGTDTPVGTQPPTPPAEAQVPAHSDAQFQIPIIDFANFLQPQNILDKVQVADQLTQAFKASGFVYLKGHGISSGQIAKTFKASVDFFKLPLDVKNSLAWKDPRANRGYVAEGRERVTQATSAEEIAALRAQTPDCKESMEIGKEDDPVWRNEWPQEAALPGYRRTMLDFRHTAHELHLQIMRALAIGLGLSESFFDDKCNEEWHTLRLLHYPSVPAKALEGGGSRAGDHSDYGSITLLFQDKVGGLEVQNPNTGTYIPAKPIDDTIVINVGDLLARWSNDTLRSTLHRVVAPHAQSSTSMTPTRYSIAYFCNPNEHQLVECLPTCFDEKRPKRYDAVTSGDYLEKRLAETYS
ncbi:Clavaminate synthase-like protein [Tilletiaria anomala UBC 951]|uniref:Clavaminate synthase-like protein n=1 Tax=Tilletiaria anomala (strain ATCC 24038 / CBS 436.72 / UBC 951) TaxID=1037660 RepID=A0A066WH93_TILAU|nr:Clavaminate synthase-like protein [Tilletiaria anomala UBC 951]KDN53201.1 Clavaminate synthase-like protein [Tilletiaria anomala UBC 951]